MAPRQVEEDRDFGAAMRPKPDLEEPRYTHTDNEDYMQKVDRFFTERAGGSYGKVSNYGRPDVQRQAPRMKSQDPEDDGDDGFEIPQWLKER